MRPACFNGAPNLPSVYPIEWLPIAATGYYKTLQRRDVATWEKWVAKHAGEWDAVAYGVAVGGVTPDLADLTPKERAGWKYTTALKIDVLLRVGHDVTVVEVKPAASTAALGAALSYARLLAREEPALDIAGGGIICGHLPLDIEWLAAQFSIRTWVV